MISWEHLDAIEAQGRLARADGVGRADNPYDTFAAGRRLMRRQGEPDFEQWRRALAWWRGWDRLTREGLLSAR